MSLPRFFLQDQVLSEVTDPVFPLRLSSDDARHFKVLRLREGEHIAVVDAASDYFECEIVSVADGVILTRISSHAEGSKARAHVVLLQGLAKGDKFDEVVRHATELGVAGFVPLACERSVVKLEGSKAEKRLDRWRSIAKSAAMQSGQLAIPEIGRPCTVQEAAESIEGATAILVCWEEASIESTIDLALQKGLSECLCPACEVRVAVVIGPEGGLTPREVETFLALDRAYAVSLGSSILRTETAGVVAPALVLYELDRMARGV